jgi:hypothetical protein
MDLTACFKAMIENRRTNKSNNKKPKRAPANKLNLILILMILLSFGLACSLNDSQASGNGNDSRQQIELGQNDKFRRLETYSVRGFKFSYYLIPKGLDRAELIATAQEIRSAEPDAQLVLVDDDTQLPEYVAYAREISLGNSGAKPPKEWANRHIIANVQKYLSGKWMLCEGNGYREIAELK